MYAKVHNRDGKTLLSFRDHFMFGPTISLNSSYSQQSLIIGDSVTNRYASFSSDDYETILELRETIKSLYNPRHSNDSAFTEENLEDEELVVNESMADDWIVTDIDMIRACGEDDKNIDFWIPQNLIKSLGMSTKREKKADDESKSRFFVESPELITL